jgi:hypothetical protein
MAFFLQVMLGWLAFVRISLLVAVVFPSFHHHLIPVSLYLVPLVIMVTVICVKPVWQCPARMRCPARLRRYRYIPCNCLLLCYDFLELPYICISVMRYSPRLDTLSGTISFIYGHHNCFNYQTSESSTSSNPNRVQFFLQAGRSSSIWYVLLDMDWADSS